MDITRVGFFRDIDGDEDEELDGFDAWTHPAPEFDWAGGPEPRKHGLRYQLVPVGGPDDPDRARAAADADEAAAGETGQEEGEGPDDMDFDPEAIDPRTGRSPIQSAVSKLTVMRRRAAMETLEALNDELERRKAGEDPHAATRDPGEERLELAKVAGCLALAQDTARAVEPRDSLETMMAHQLAAAHTLAMRLSGRAISLSGEPALPAWERCLLEIVPRDRDAARVSQSAARMMAEFRGGLLALDRIRNGNRLTIAVERAET